MNEFIGIIVEFFTILIDFIFKYFDYIIVFFAGYTYLKFNELEDECVRNKWTFCEKFLNSELSWKNKWYWNEHNERIPNQRPRWAYLWLWVPDYQERFWLSTTIFVWKTDGEHLFQHIKHLAIFIGFLAISWEWAIIWFLGKSLSQLIKELKGWLSL